MSKKGVHSIDMCKISKHQCSCQYHKYCHFDGWEKEGMFGEGKTAIIDGWEPNPKALACL